MTGHLAVVSRDPLSQLTGYAREYGDVVKLRLLHLPAMLVSHPRLIEQVLVTRAASFSKSVDVRATRLLLGNGLLTSEGDTWRRARRGMQPAFQHRRVAGYERIFTTSASEVSSSWQDGQTLELRREMTRLTLRSATRALFGADVADEESRIGRAIDALFRLFDISSSFAYLLPNFLPTPAHLRALLAMRRLDRLVARMVAERKARGRVGDDLLGLLLELSASENGRAGRFIRDQMMTLLIAGHETTSAALTWIWYLLALHPEANRKLRRELATSLGGRRPEPGDLPLLRYTARVVTESMRLYPPVWMMGREATEDTEIGGYPVAKGTTIYLSQWVTHRDSRFYAEPERFDPDRWTEEFSRALPPFAYFPFGGGARVCIGASFARTEAILALATIAQRFQFSLAEPETPVTPWPSVTLRPKDGLRVMVHRIESQTTNQ